MISYISSMGFITIFRHHLGAYCFTFPNIEQPNPSMANPPKLKDFTWHIRTPKNKDPPGTWWVLNFTVFFGDVYNSGEHSYPDLQDMLIFAFGQGFFSWWKGNSFTSLEDPGIANPPENWSSKVFWYPKWRYWYLKKIQQFWRVWFPLHKPYIYSLYNRYDIIG